MRPLLFTNGRLRPLALQDAPALATIANDRDIWLNLRDAFPHPYTVDDAAGFIAHAQAQRRPEAVAIEFAGDVAGVIGATRGTDVQMVGAEVGYWLGRAFWGRGIVTNALMAYRDWVIPAWQLTRLFALPFADNHASCRVLEKSGFVREGVLRASARKNGVLKDQAMYAYVSVT
ncbi:MAG: GNAT family N-acetyltransferase [Pseudomonadota bacterium]